jgi:hypothetical protein
MKPGPVPVVFLDELQAIANKAATKRMVYFIVRRLVV